MADAPKRTMTLTDDTDGKSWKLPVLDGTVGPSVIDIRKLYNDTGYFTHDPGFTSTSSCESKITLIDGDKGILLHRGYPIDQLAEKSDFLEVAYLHGIRRTAGRDPEKRLDQAYHLPHDGA